MFDHFEPLSEKDYISAVAVIYTMFNKLSFHDRFITKEFNRRLAQQSVLTFYIKYGNLEYLLFSKWKCGVCGKYNRKRCIEEC